MKNGEKKPNRNPTVRAAWLRGQLNVQIRVPKPLAKEMRALAELEALPLAAWIRLTCAREVRRARRAA